MNDSPWKPHFKKCVLTFILVTQGVFNCVANEPITPIVQTDNLNLQKFELGQMLFKDTRLSGNKKTSCLTCHDLASGGDDGLVNPLNLAFNSPTIFNVSKNYYLGWQGKFSQLKPHLIFILDNPKVMGTDWPFVIKTFENDAVYTESFHSLYEGDISKDTIIDALLYYESNLVRPSKFDAFLLGDFDAISAAAKLGYEKFTDYGCVSCHQGANVGGNVFQVLGVFTPFKGLDGNYITQKLRVPSLRNVAQTAPYFHDGSISSLKDAIKIMAEYQLGQILTNEEIAQISAFLISLNSISDKVSYEEN